VQDYSDCYAILGLPQDTDWETLRAQYRRLIGQWHPDRFSADTAQQDLAEERSKQITAAYQALEKYRRDHGALPPVEFAAARADAQRPRWEAGTVSGRASSKDRSETGATAATERELTKRRPRRRWRVAIALFALIAGLYVAYRYVDAWAPNDDQPKDSAHEAPVAPPLPQRVAVPGEPTGISTGSTFGDVYAIQGIPSLTQGDTWYYGRSQIRFAQGVVISWNEDPDNPLRIARNQPFQAHDGHFKVGSTKDEVRATQGTPVTETATVWDYGPSRVNFEHNRVVRWEESPLQPLRVPR